MEGLDPATLDACQAAGYVVPTRLTGGDDSRWWAEQDVSRLRDILRFRRQGLELAAAYERAREDRFFGLCPCDWRN
ncbi:MAG: hypothetical protein ABR559_01220 [Gemmatimonadota bacterium]